MVDDNPDFDDDKGGFGREDTLLKPKSKTKKPNMYKVILLNDEHADPRNGGIAQ